MAQEHANNTIPGELAAETKERGGCFDFMKKKGDKTRDDNDEDVVVTGQSTGDHDKQHTLGEELHHSHSSSSSEEEEVEEGGERKKKKKKKTGLRESIKEKLSGNADTCVDLPMEEAQPAAETEEKKGFMEKIREKLPGHHHKSHADEEEAKAGAQTHHDDHPSPSTYADDRAKEKKGILDKIKEKLPGGNNKADHESDLKKD